IVSVELCTLHFQKKKTLDNFIASAIFADGAGALLIQSQPGKKKYFGLQGFHCELLPQTSHEMAWHITDHGFDMILTSYVPKIIHSGISQFMQNLLAQHQFLPKNIDYFAIHPGGMKILQACEQALNLTAQDNKFSYQVL